MLTVLIDDVRSFRDRRECLVARSSREAVALLRSLAGQPIGELWLDHDLVGDDTIWPVVELLCGEQFDIGAVVVHASRPGPAIRVVKALRGAGYEVRRDYDLRRWTHQEVSDPRANLES